MAAVGADAHVTRTPCRRAWGDADTSTSGLPEEPRSTLRMRFVDEATYPEIAATLGVPPRAAEKRVSRSLRRLRARMDIS